MNSNRRAVAVFLALVASITGAWSVRAQPACPQARRDLVVGRSGTSSFAYTGTDPGVGTTKLRLTSLGRLIYAGAPYTVWSVRNVGTAPRVVTLSASGASMSLHMSARSELIVRSEVTAGTAVHTLTIPTGQGGQVVNSLAAGNTTWTDATLASDASCAPAPPAIWLVQDRGAYRMLPDGATLLDAPFAQGWDRAAADPRTGRLWTVAGGRLRSYDAKGALTSDVALGVTPSGSAASRQLAFDAAHTQLWLTFANRVLRLSVADGSILGDVTLGGTVRGLTLDASGSVAWVATTGGLAVLRPGSPAEPGIVVVTQVALAGGALAVAADDVHHEAWFTTTGTLARVDAAGLSTLQTAITLMDAPQMLSADGQGGVWGAAGATLGHFDGEGTQVWVTGFYENPDGPDGITALASNPDDGSVWASGLAEVRLYPAEPLPLPYPPPPGGGGESSLVAAPAGLMVPVPTPCNECTAQLHPSLGLTFPRAWRQILFAVDRTPPTIQFGVPTDGAFIGERRPLLTVTYSATSAAVDTEALAFTLDGAPLAVSCSSVTTTSATCLPVGDLPEGTAALGVSIADVRGRRSAAALRTFVVDTLAPAIAVEHPAAGSFTNQPAGPLVGSVSEPVTLMLGGQPVTVGSDQRFSATLALVEGVNQLALTATDRAGNTSALTHALTLDTVRPAAPLRANVSVGPPTAGSVTVSGTAGAVEGSAAVQATNLRTGVAVTVLANGAGAFSLTLGAQAGDTIRITAADAAGNISDPTDVAVAGGGTGSPLTLTVLEPLPALVTAERFVLVRGQVVGGQDVAVSVAGTLAAISGDGPVVFSALVPLPALGSNGLVVQASTPAGDQISTVVTVTRSGDAPFAVTASPDGGLAPLNVAFEIRQYVEDPPARLELDFDGDGTFDTSTLLPIAPVAHTYAAAGTFTAVARVSDFKGGVFTYRLPITVGTAAEVDAKARRAWSGLVAALAARNSTVALRHVATSAQEEFAQIFASLDADWPAITTSFTSFTPVVLSGDLATYALVREIDGSPQTFLVEFVRDWDGIWRLSGL